jgi:hypothetical protein
MFNPSSQLAVKPQQQLQQGLEVPLFRRRRKQSGRKSSTSLLGEPYLLESTWHDSSWCSQTHTGHKAL